ncbi:MAG: hypothetical protein E7642_07935 [Ruminococcaceae bacterium]|nr:hypothetical protein [Oscillospiraceae bacterium]
MKKTLLIVLSIVLCVSMLTGCFSSFKEEAKEDIKNNVETAKPNTDSNTDGNNTDTPVDRANMQVAIDSFNKIDLSAFGEIPTDYVETLKELINEVAFALELEAEGDFDEKGEFSADVKMKDGKFYFDIVGHGENEEENGIKSFIVFDSNTLDTYANFIADGESEGWVKHTQDISEFTEQLAAAYNPEMISELLGKVVITKLEEKYLTKKDDMLLLSNDYIIDLVVANIPLIEELSGEEIADDEIAEFKEDAKESFEEVGLEIYLGTGVDSITKLAVSAKEDDNSFYAELVLTDDATALDHVTVKVKTELGEGDLKYAPETVITLQSIYDEEGNAVGLDMDGTIYAVGSASSNWEQVGDSEEKYTRKAVIQKITLDCVLDFGAIGKTSADIFKLSVDAEPIKAIETVELFNYETGEEKLISAKEGKLSEYDEKMNLLINLKSENENKITFKFEMYEGDYVVAANGEAAVSDKTLSFNFNAFEDGEEVFSLDGSVTSVDDSTVTFKLNVNVEDEGYINFDGKLYVGEDVVLPAFPTDYEVVENNPLFGSVNEPEYVPEEPMQTETEKFPDNAE